MIIDMSLVNRYISAVAVLTAALVSTDVNAQTASVTDTAATTNAAKCMPLADLRQYLPRVSAAARIKYELDTEHGRNRFQVRSVCVRFSGQVGPVVDYYLQADLCDQGKMRVLDAYVGFRPDSHWRIFVGQSRVPFSVDASRAPETYLFINRSFIGHYIGNQRSVGVKAGYSTGEVVPLYVEGGVFNSAPISDHTPWEKHFTYGIKARATIAGIVTPEIAYKSDVPQGGVRTHLVSVATTLNYGPWMAEGEYVLQNYSRGRFKRCHGFNIMGRYTTPVKLGMFNRWSAELRYDGMSDHSTSVLDPEGRLVCNDIRRKRITAGTTLSYWRGTAHVDLRVNYEQYFYPKAYDVPVGEGNKLSASVILFF